MLEPSKSNLFQNLPESLPDEIFEAIIDQPNIRLERIVSAGHCSEPGFWYEQAQHEWVLLVQGRARIEFESEWPDCDMVPGDHMIIPAQRRHRVAWSTPDETTIWLALFYHPESQTTI